MRVAAALLEGSTPSTGRLDDWWVLTQEGRSEEDLDRRIRRLRTRADDVDACGSVRWLRTYDGHAEQWQPSRCRDRLCARCWAMTASRREREVTAQISRAYALGYRLCPVTLTVRCRRWRGGRRRRPPDPRRDVDAVLSAWRDVLQRARRDDAVVAGWRRLETTWSRPRERGGQVTCRAHAHLHVAFLVPATMDLEELRDAVVPRWIAAMAERGLKAIPEAQAVEEVRTTEEDACRYFLKYLQKPDEYVKTPAIAGLASHTLASRQLVAAFGAAHGRAVGEFADELKKVRGELAEERERYGAARLCDAWKESHALLPVHLQNEMLDSAPEWAVRKYELDPAVMLKWRITPKALEMLVELGNDVAAQWARQLAALERARQADVAEGREHSRSRAQRKARKMREQDAKAVIVIGEQSTRAA